MDSGKEDDEEEKVVDAQEVFVLMHDDYRISRNARSKWYFSKINHTVTCNPNQWKSPVEELQVLCASGPTDVLEEERSLVYRITPSTHVTFVAKAYRVVFVLDMSPSISTVDLSSSSVLYEEVFVNLQNALRALVKPYRLPECDVLFQSKIYVTVIAHTSLINCRTNQVLLQGCLMTPDNLDRILDQLRRDLDLFESNMATSLAETLDVNYFQAEEDQKITWGLFEEHERADSPDPAMNVMSPEASFINSLRYGILALQLMPENSTAGLVVITDGVVGVPDHSLFESLMMQLRHTTVSCSFIQLGRGFQLQSGLGHVPYPELLEFIASATMGTFFTALPAMDNYEGMNPIQEALLSQSFQQLTVTAETSHGFLSRQNSGRWNLNQPHADKLSSTLHIRKHREKNLHVPISALIACRLREGYFIKDVTLSKGNAQLEVRMMLPWRNGVHVHYLAVSVWPLNNNKRHTHIEVSVEGSYDFLRDMTSHIKQKSIKTSSYRMGLVKKYWQNLQAMSETDELLVHLQSFATNTVYYKVCDSLKQGIPLFYLPPNQTSPQINTQLTNKDQSLNQFATFWKPVLMLDINIWQKWMHTHRLGFIMEHDVPLGKHLHIPNSSGRFHNVSCRQASSALGFFLRDYSTFVLMENHSYVTLLFRETDKPPWSFFVIRVASKPPCLVLRIAFLGGTPGHERNEIISDLKEKLANLKRQPVKDDKGKVALQRRGSRADLERKHLPPLQRPPSDIPCCVLTRKPIEKILIRYERMPRDFNTVNMSRLMEHSGHSLPMTANKMAFNVYTALSRYLFHRRWVWSVQHGSSMPISMQAVGRILSNLTKIRLQEGFNVAHTYCGIVNLVLELEMKSPEQDDDEIIEDDTCSNSLPCVVQYVVFPPHTTTSKGSVSEEDPEEMESVEADGELQVITECWVEPQRGVVTNSSAQAQQYDGLTYKEITQTMFPTDLDCISTMITFEHLNLMCQSFSVPSPALLGTAPMPNVVEEDYLTSMSADISIQAVPFTFDLLRLLPKCQQVELLFSTYIQEFHDGVIDDRSRSGTLTDKGLDHHTAEADYLEASEAQHQAPPCPNEQLFSLFLESLYCVHDREIHLTNVECEHLVGLIHQRHRDKDKYPLPFIPKQNRLITEEDIMERVDQKDDHLHRSGSALSLATSLSVGSFAAQSQTPSTVLSQSQTAGSQIGAFQRLMSTATSTPVQTRVVSPVGRDMDADSCKAYQSESHCPTNINMAELDTRSVARWRCFVRSLTSTHMMLCFVPASFHDLLLLVDTDSKLRRQSKSGAASKRSSVSGLSHPMSPNDSILHQSRSDVQSPSAPEQRCVSVKEPTGTNTDTVTQSSPQSTKNLSQDDTQKHLVASELSQDPEQGGQEDPSKSVDESAVPPCCPDPPSNHISVNLPVYVYNCPLSLLSEEIVNKWTFNPPEDIFEDLTFVGVEQASTDSQAPREEHVAASSSRSRKISELDLGHRDGQPEDVYHSAKELKQHCTMVSETYLRSFVKGLYRSLQYGCHIDCHDIESAINEICEESLPLEIDISQFLQYSCGHVRQLIDRNNQERTLREDMYKAMPKMMDKGQEESSEDMQRDCLMHSDDMAQRAVTPLYFPLHTLQETKDCGSSMALHQLIRHRFQDIVKCYFKPVPSQPDYYYFSPPSSQMDLLLPCDSHDLPMMDSQDAERGITVTQAPAMSQVGAIPADLLDNKALSIDIRSDVSILDRKTTVSGDSVVLYEDVASCMAGGLAEGQGSDYDKHSISTASQLVDDDDINGEDLTAGPTDMPLFVNMACSVRLGNSLKSIPIKHIPLCFNEIQDCLSNLESTIDLSTVRVTLDVICLTLPPEEDLSENLHRPCYQRMTSHASQMSYNSGSAGEDIPEVDESLSMVDNSVMQRSMGVDPLAHLPSVQREAVGVCKDQILWLLKDEITSIMRSIVPVTMETLEMVAQHIQNSHEKTMCNTKEVLLKFVGGADTSLTLFIEDFERMNLPGYHLNREDSYYYLSVDKVFDVNQAHAKALQNALSHLDFIGPQPEAKDVSVPTTKPEGEMEGIEIISAETGLEVITEQISPAHGDVPAMKSALELQNLWTHGNPDIEGFRVEDIKISVTRPSPIKELPKSGSSGGLPRAKIKDDTEDPGGYLSDKSSGSSIQVLDDKPESEQQHEVHRGYEKTPEKPLSEAKQMDEIPEKKADIVPEVHIRTRSLSGQSSRHSSGDRPSRHSSGARSTDGLSMSSPSPLLDKSLSKDDIIAAHHPRGLSPLTIMGMDVERKTIKRVHSSASIEKYRHEKAKFSSKGSSAGMSGWSTPQRRPSDGQTPSRSRHHSGLQTPMSAIETSSRSSIGDDGYDGDSSDLDEDGGMMSFNETQTLRKAVLPQFWLIMKIEMDKVCVFFHTRDTGEPDQEQIVQYKSLYNQVVTKIVDTCRVVNQKLLLDVLYNTRMCDKLLVPEADEEVRWGKDHCSHSSRHRQDGDSDESDPEGQVKYFDAARDTDPGHFACQCVWQTSFVLHPRLKTGPGRGGMSRGIQTLRSAVLNKFSVNNRNNMFVYKESSTKSVFYMRLEETPGDVVPVTPSEVPRPEDLSVSRSSSILSLNFRKSMEQEDDPTTPHTADRSAEGLFGQEKRPSLNRQRSEDIITLSAHGIGPVGPEISKDLVELLQKKLDDAVLKLLTEILARNPMCKLTPEDVQFIQRPNSAPKKTLAFTIPASAMLQQFALSYYLRQNLQQFLHTPKYMDAKQQGIFMDYTQTPPSLMADECVFLYNRSQLSRGNGIACLYLSFVDCKGHPIQLITSPKPLAEAYMDHIDHANFDSLVESSPYELHKKTPTKAPGPMALVQFTIWAQGTIDMTTLSEHLLLAMNHSVADVITEYRLLTAPLCEPPLHYYKGLDTPCCSAPPSPGMGRGIDSRHSVSSSDIKKQILDMPEKTPKEKQTFSLQAIMSDIFNKKETPKEEPEDTQPPWQEVEAARRRRQDIRDKIQRYESGEKGTLLPIYYTTLYNWFNFCHQLKIPSVTKQELHISARFPVDYILKDLAAAINAVSQDVLAKTFRQVDGTDGVVYYPCSTNRSPTEHKDKTNESIDFASLQNRCQNTPGVSSNYVMIGRNTKQWRASIEYHSSGEDSLTELPSLTNPKTHKSYQKYRPLEPMDKAGRPEASGVSSMDKTEHVFIPRQRLLIVFVNDKKLTLFMYNWAAELCSNLERQLIRLVQWHNARSQVLLSILSQKMGLFRHNPLRAISASDLSNSYIEPNPFSQTYSELDLVKFTCPPSQPTQTRGRGSGPGASSLNDVYKNVKPANPMHKSGYAKLRDPVHRHGAQLLELSNFVKKENDKKLSLQKLYLDWQQRITIPNTQIPEDMLSLLKRSSRLIHSVATPFMFSQNWSKKILGKQDLLKKPDAQAEPKQSRSRHSSGASIKSKRSNSIDGRWRTQSSVDSPDISARTNKEEAWHEELRKTFMNEYSQYLQNLGIQPVKTREGTMHRRFNIHQVPDESNRKTGMAMKPNHCYLQKTLPGGIMLIEIGFSDVYFLINIYGFEVSSLPVSKNINTHLAVMFTDECEKYKDLTHAHSFAHDFHLKMITRYVHGSPQASLGKPHYHVTGFLQDFVQQFPYAPNYTLNYIYENCLVIRNTNSPGQQLFEYMLQHESVYNMKKIKMLSTGDDPEIEEHALVSLEDQPTLNPEGQEASSVQSQDYSLALIFAHDQPASAVDSDTCLRLKYWVILVNKRQRYPESRVERRVAQPKVIVFPADPSSFRCKNKSDQVASHLSVDLAPEALDLGTDDTDRGTPPLDNMNYLGYSNAHQIPVHVLLVREAQQARDRILQVVNATITHCRRDLLWQRMLTGDMDEGEGRRKRHKTGDLQEPRGPYMTRLSFHEFQEMINMVKRDQISDIDPQLKPIESMPSTWYHNLGKTLMLKYAQSLRCFRSADGLMQHYVVVNPRHLDMIMLLSIDTLADHSELCFVYKEQDVSGDQSRSSETTRLQALELFETFINTCCYHMWTSLM